MLITNASRLNVFRFIFIIGMFTMCHLVNKRCCLRIHFSQSTILGLYYSILFQWHLLILLIELRCYCYFVIYFCIIMSSGVSSVFRECAGCHRRFKRFASHIVQSPMCQQVYVTCQDNVPPDGGESDVSKGLSSRRSTRWVSSNLLPRTAGSTNGPVTCCNDVSLPSGDASAASEGTFCLGSHILFRHFPSLDAFLFWLQHILLRLHMI